MPRLPVFDLAALSAPQPTGPRSILRLLQVLAHLGACPHGQTLTQLCQALALPKTTLFTMVKVLEGAGYLTQHSGAYRLGAAALALGAAMAQGPRASLPECAQGILQSLAQRSGETGFLSVLTPDRQHCHYLATVESDHWLRYSVKLGSQKPAYATGTGRAMLAYLPDPELRRLLDGIRFERLTPQTISSRRALLAGLRAVRLCGVSTVDGGTVAGVVSVAAPIFDAEGSVVAAVSIGGPTSRIGPRLGTIEAAVREGARAISELLGYRGPWPPAR